jgi:integrase
MLQKPVLPTRNVLHFNRLRCTQMAAMNIIRNMWQTSTWKTRRNTWDRMQEFADANNLDPLQHLDWAATLFAESTRATTVPATRLKYVSDLRSIAKRFGIETPICSMYASGLRNSGALIPQNQARPATLDEMHKLARAAMDVRHGHRLYAALFLAWKTASRWSEISRLRKDMFLEVSQQRIIISWRDQTKTTRADPFRPDSWAIVIHDPAIPLRVVQAIQELDDQDQWLWSRTTEWFDRWAAKIVPGLTAHSIKSGAVGVLAEAVVAQKLSQKLLSRIAKHKMTGDSETAATTTIKYIRDPIVAAQMMQTDQATRLLPW